MFKGYKVAAFDFKRLCSAPIKRRLHLEICCVAVVQNIVENINRLGIDFSIGCMFGYKNYSITRVELLQPLTVNLKHAIA